MVLFLIIFFASVYWGCGGPGNVETVTLEFPKLFKDLVAVHKPRCAEGLCFVSKIIPTDKSEIIVSLVSVEVLNELADGFVSDYYRSAQMVVDSANSVFSFLSLASSKSSCIWFKYIFIGTGEKWMEKINKIELIKIRRMSQLVQLDTPSIWFYDRNIVRIAKSYDQFPKSENPHEYITVAGSFCKDMSRYRVDSSSIEIYFKKSSYPQINVSQIKSIKN